MFDPSDRLAGLCQSMRGATYLPSYAANTVQAWLHYDPRAVRHELGYARSVGLNTVRVFLQFAVYRTSPGQFLHDLRDLLCAADARELSVILCLYDGCFGHPASVENDGIPPDPATRFFPWVACPGLESLRPEFYPEGDRYVEDVVSAVAEQENLLLWEIMNEPFSSSEAILNTAGNQEPTVVEARSRIVEFCRHYSALVRRADASRAVTIGVSDQGKLEYFQDSVDVLSFHEYCADADAFEGLLQTALAKAERAGKPLLLTECGAMGQEMAMVAPLCKRHRVGWCFTWLMVTGAFTDDAGLFLADGTPRDPKELDAIRGACAT